MKLISTVLMASILMGAFAGLMFYGLTFGAGHRTQQCWEAPSYQMFRLCMLRDAQ